MSAKPVGPRVSVIMIFYNSAEYIAEAIESVDGQTCRDFEFLLVDDGSKDASGAMAREYVDAHPGQARYLHHPGFANRGMSATRNVGLDAARGDYIAFIDSDDRWKPHKIADQVAFFQSHPEVDALFGAVNYWRAWNGGMDQLIPTGHVQGQLVCPPEALVKVYPLGTTAAPCPSDFMVRRNVAVALGGFEESFPGMYEDQAFFAKLYLNRKIYFDARNWLDYRIHQNSCSAGMLRSGTYREVRARFLDWFGSYLERNPAQVTPQIVKAMAKARFRNRHPLIDRFMKPLERP